MFTILNKLEKQTIKLAIDRAVRKKDFTETEVKKEAPILHSIWKNYPNKKTLMTKRLNGFEKNLITGMLEGYTEGGFTEEGLSRQTPKLYKIYTEQKKRERRKI